MACQNTLMTTTRCSLRSPELNVSCPGLPRGLARPLLAYLLGLGTVALLLAGSAGAATITYDSNNTPYTGGTIAPGDTVLLNDGATVTGNITDNGTLQFNQSAGNTLTISNLISGTGMLSLTNTGTVNLTGTSAATNTVVLDMTTSAAAGRLQIRSGTGILRVGSSGTGTLSVNGGSVTDANGYIGYNAGSVGTATVSSGTWANSGSLYVGRSGTGTLTMTGGVVSVGGTVSTGTAGTISLNAGGTLQIGTGTTGGVLGVNSLTNNGTLIFNRSDDSAYAGIISGTGAVTKQGGGTLTLDGANSYSGVTTISGGVIAYGASNVLSDSTAVTVAGGGLDLGSYTDTVTSFTITSGTLFGSGKLTAATYALLGGTVAGNLGGGSLTVTANSNLNGTADVTSLRLNAGTLTLGSAGRFTSNQIALTGSSGASLSLGGSESVGSLAGAFNIALGSATLTTGNGNTSTTYAGTLSGSGGFAKTGTGTFTLSGSSSYTGATAVDGGKLLVNGQLGNTAVAVNASGLLGGSGTILGNVTVASSGTLAPGNSPGVLTVGSLSLLAGSHTLMEITGTAAGLYDQVFGTGSGGLTYGGTLDLVMSGSYADQTTFQLFSSFSSPSIGDFAAVGLNATGEYAGLTFTGDGGVWTSTETANGQRLIFSTGTGDLVVVPEPSTYAMAVAGIACWGWQMFRRRRLRQASTLAA